VKAAEIAQVVPAYGCITYDRIEPEGMQTPCAGPDGAGTSLLYVDSFPKGKAVVGPLDSAIGGTVTDKEFPLALITGTVREHHGTGVRSRRSSGLTKLVAEAVLEISAEDAKQAKAGDGDKVRVVSQRGGVVEVTVKVSARVPAGVAFLPGFSATAPVSRLQGHAGSTMPAVRIERI
jgi:predicted molibdopterin-dependent oxidoreductase YjgC